MAETNTQSDQAKAEPVVLALAGPSPRRRSSRFRIVVLALLLLNTAIVIFVGSVLMGVLSIGKGQSVSQAKPVEPQHAQNLSQSRPTTIAAADQAVSWRQAESAFSKNNYEAALESYRSLWKVTSAIPSESKIADYLLLRQCQCMLALGQNTQARESLESLIKSDSSVVRGAANCFLAVCEAKDTARLQARRRAYTAIAALGAAQRMPEMLADCEFLIARCLTEEVFSLANGQSVRSEPSAPKDPFAGMDEQALRRMIDEDSACMKGSGLGPVVVKLPGQTVVKKYSAAAAQASLGDFLNCLSVAAGVEVKWESVSLAARQRVVTLSFREATHQQLAEVACGMAGLVARFTGEGVVVRDPADDSTTQRRELLIAEAMSAWRRIFLRLNDDPRISEGHYSLAGLYGCAGDKNSAISEYHLTAARFPLSQWAPEALLQAARSRVNLGDYPGAYKDLTDLLDSYPGYRFSDSAYLELGSVSMKAGQLDEAIRCFTKLYHLNLSPTSRIEAALKLAQCYRQQANFKLAVEWFSVFTAQARDIPADQLCEAYLLLGQSHSALGNSGQAVKAFRMAVESSVGSDANIRTSLELAKELLKSEQYAAALACLHRLESVRLSEEQSYAHVILNAQVLRAAGLPDRAGALLKNKLPSLNDPQLRVRAAVELARCRAESGDLADARSLLAEALPLMEAGPEASQATCELAEVCLRAGQNEQAIAVARELLKNDCSEVLAGKVRKILSAAYLNRHDYENAAAMVSLAATSQPVLAKGQEARP